MIIEKFFKIGRNQRSIEVISRNLWLECFADSFLFLKENPRISGTERKMKVKIFIIVVIILAAFALMGIAIAGENISVSREEAEYLHQVFFSALKEEAEKKGKAIPEALSVDLIKIECDIRRFEGYNIKTKTLVATAYVRWAAGEKSGVFQVSETLRLAVGGLEISKEPISLQELSRIQRRIAEVLVLWLPA